MSNFWGVMQPLPRIEPSTVNATDRSDVGRHDARRPLVFVGHHVDGTDVDFGDAAGDDGGGDVFDICGSAGVSAPSMVDAGRGTTLSRRRLVGANTPCRAFIPNDH